MASFSVLHQVIVVVANTTTVGSSGDVRKILSSNLFYPTKQKIVSRKAATAEQKKAETPTPTPHDILKSTSLGMDIIGKLMAVVRSRASHFTMKVDPIKQSELYYACQTIFDNFDGNVTFKMYEHAMKQYRLLMNGLQVN